jgi:SAM-dependent methyltransferase
MPPEQDEVFRSSEGDRWFLRNRRALRKLDVRRDGPMRLARLYGLRPKKVLEIGAANGYRLAAVRKALGARVTVAVEVSAAAIADGRSRHPNVRFVRAAASSVPLKGRFDLVIVNFVFHWVGRRNLRRAVAETDRLLADGGHLLIGDFYPDRPHRRPYHHLPGGVFTYKQDYAKPFLATGRYSLLALLSAHHATKELSADVAADERTATWLLRKRKAA